MLIDRYQFRPFYAAEGTAAGATAPSESTAQVASPPQPTETVSAPAATEVKPAAEAAPVAAPAAPDAAAAEPVKAEPASDAGKSLLELADGKPDTKSDAKSDVKPEGAKPDKATETPAPADAAKAEPAKAEGEKPEAKAPADAAKATDPAKDATALTPPAPLKYDAFKVPEGIKLDDKELAKFTDIVGARQLPQEDAQKLVDLYIADRQRMFEELRQDQRKVWDTLNDTWKTDLRKDPVLGGNRLETSLSMAKAVIEEYGGSPDEVRELLAHTSNNGMGNYPGFVRLLHNLGKALNIFEDGMVPANPSPPKPVKSPGNRGWYSSMGQGNGAAQS